MLLRLRDVQCHHLTVIIVHLFCFAPQPPACRLVAACNYRLNSRQWSNHWTHKYTKDLYWTQSLVRSQVCVCLAHSCCRNWLVKYLPVTEPESTHNVLTSDQNLTCCVHRIPGFLYVLLEGRNSTVNSAYAPYWANYYSRPTRLWMS